MTKQEMLEEVSILREKFKQIANDESRSDRERMIAIGELSRLHNTEQHIKENF